MLKKLISLKIAPGENRGHFTSFGVVTFFYILCRRQRPVLVDKTAKSVDLFALDAYNSSFSFVAYKSCTQVTVIFCNFFDSFCMKFSFIFLTTCGSILPRIIFLLLRFVREEVLVFPFFPCHCQRDSGNGGAHQSIF